MTLTKAAGASGIAEEPNRPHNLKHASGKRFRFRDKDMLEAGKPKPAART